MPHWPLSVSWWHKQGQTVTNGLTCMWQGSRPLRNTSENWTIVLLTKVLTSHSCKEIFLKLGGRADLVLDPLCLAKFTSVISKGFGLTKFLVLLSDTGWPSEGPISSLYLCPSGCPITSVHTLGESTGHEVSLTSLVIVLDCSPPDCKSKMLLDSATLYDICSGLAEPR